ncbi:hypothetical protein [methanotrophic endosymbiont of Bathymodiolus puteoserpentis (Logatchev)]|jgi:hypothetical protein|uniref:hypothetical protein n=1 Tax=methanotrophic endosymbiont of Bathymodiolus puteoserpentis (Logatchev) TaxID=343235 RepID=UPI0013C6B65C|nr:hypothetical protein [methanotrophic endosymbiont of Bathymodiolus puteoserpentis (Logatchev)]SHE19153.1 hypothetical protein BPUTEOMOX_16 [methanotrophic endosymbiont of Bathymodiolus puteoserpentis (Logatchev)]
MYKVLFIVMLFTTFASQAQPAAPILHVKTEGTEVSLNWSSTNNAVGYRLFYAAFPFQGEASIGSIDMHSATNFTTTLWQDAAFYVAVQAYDSSQKNSDYSNIGFLQIQDRGAGYRDFWQILSKEINAATFASSDFLYRQLPAVESCFAGSLSDTAKNRALTTLNKIRELHQIPPVIYDHTADLEVQQSALIQRANNFLAHKPNTSALCYSQAGFDGSSSSNLHLGSGNSDPAEDLIGFVDDAFNLSTVAAVGHRRALLNPFLSQTSYGQVLGASAVKVFNFSDSSMSEPTEKPDFVAFPYLRYPYLFFSDKTSTKNTPWSFSLIEDKSSLWVNQQDYFANINLTVKQKSNGHVLTLKNIHTDTAGIGVPNNLSWEVDNWQYDTWYTVTIDNIRYQSSETISIHYDVLIDYKNIIDINFPLEAGDQQSGLSMQGLISDKHDKDSYSLNLPAGIHSFIGSSQFSNMAFYIAVYDIDKQLLMASDKAFTLNLAAGRYTIVISNCHQQTCYTQPTSYRVQVN